MSEEKSSENQYQEVLEATKTAKAAVAEAKGELRKFKRANKIRPEEEIKDKKVATEYATLEKAAEDAQAKYDELTAKAAELKPAKARAGGGSYAYTQIQDPETGELRDATAKEQKRWRTHARKVAKKEGILAKDVPFDPNFFAPKVKTEKAEKVKKGDAEKAPEAEAAVAETAPAADTKREKREKRKAGK